MPIGFTHAPVCSSPGTRPQFGAWMRAGTGRYFEPVQNGKPLEDELYKCFKGRQSVAVVSMPGTGKTYNALSAARRLLREGLVGAIIHIEGSRDWSADELLTERLIVDGKSERLVRVQRPLLVEKIARTVRRLRAEGCDLTLDDAMPRVAETELKDARRLWKRHKKLWVLVIIDEFTRINQSQIDRLLTLLNDYKLRVNGEDRFCPVQVCLLGNPAGMDPGTGTLGHAFYSRIHKWLALRDVDIATSAESWIPAFLDTVADENETPAMCRPSREHCWLAAVVRYSLWGTFDEARRGVHQLPEDARQWLLRASELDPVFRDLLAEIAPLTTFGHSSRNAQRWAAAAMLRAQEANQPFRDEFMLQEALACLAVGAATSYSPGVRPDTQIKYESLVTAIAARVLTHPPLRNLVREMAEPFALVGALAAGLYAPGRAGDAQARDAVRAALAPRPASARALRFLRAVANLAAAGGGGTTHNSALWGFVVPVSNVSPAEGADVARRVEALARGRAEGERISDDPVLNRAGEFVGAADRDLLAALFAGAVPLSPLGGALRALLTGEDGRPRRVDLGDEVREGLSGTRAAPFGGHVADAVSRFPRFRGAVADVCAVLATAFAADAAEAPDGTPAAVAADRARRFPAGAEYPAHETRSLFRHLFAAVRRRANVPYFARLDTILSDLEGGA